MSEQHLLMRTTPQFNMTLNLKYELVHKAVEGRGEALTTASFYVQQGKFARTGNVCTSMFPVVTPLEASMCLPRSPDVVAI